LEHGKIELMSNCRPIRYRCLVCSLAIACLALAGCKHDVWEHQRSDVITQYRVPPSAKVVGEGAGTLEFTAPERGLIYIVDLDQPKTLSNKDGSVHQTVYKIVLQALLLEGQQYYFDPHAGLAGWRGDIDEARAPSPVKVAPDHRYRALFDTKELEE
jgi:hypothetical protein